MVGRVGHGVIVLNARFILSFPDCPGCVRLNDELAMGDGSLRPVVVTHRSGEPFGVPHNVPCSIVFPFVESSFRSQMAWHLMVPGRHHRMEGTCFLFQDTHIVYGRIFRRSVGTLDQFILPTCCLGKFVSSLGTCGGSPPPIRALSNKC